MQYPTRYEHGQTIEILTRKTNNMKTLGDKIIGILYDSKKLEIMVEGMKFEVNTKSKMNSLLILLRKSVKKEDKYTNQQGSPYETAKLTKLSIKDLNEDPIKWQEFLDSFEASILHSKMISKLENLKYNQLLFNHYNNPVRYKDNSFLRQIQLF